MAATAFSLGAFDRLFLCWFRLHVFWLGASFSDWLPDYQSSFFCLDRLCQYFGPFLSFHFVHRCSLIAIFVVLARSFVNLVRVEV